MLLGAAAGFALKPQAAQAVQVPVDALVWKAKSESASGECTPLLARQAYGRKFINYLARFLLTYDRPSRQLWRARAAECPLSWSTEQVTNARVQHLGEFEGAVEISLRRAGDAAGRRFVV